MWHEDDRVAKIIEEFVDNLYPNHKPIKFSIDHHPEMVFDYNGVLEAYTMPTDRRRTITIEINKP